MDRQWKRKQHTSTQLITKRVQPVKTDRLAHSIYHFSSRHGESGTAYAKD